MSKQFLEYHVYQMRTLSHKIFCKSINFKIKYCKTFHCPLRKISLHYQTVIDQRLTAFHQLFSWTSVGLSKCLIDKMIGSQGHLNVSEVPVVQHDIIQRLFETNSSQMNQFPKQS